jgi:hypothetical protein
MPWVKGHSEYDMPSSSAPLDPGTPSSPAPPDESQSTFEQFKSLRMKWVHEASDNNTYVEVELPPLIIKRKTLSKEAQLAEECMRALFENDKRKTPMQRHESHICQASYFLHCGDSEKIRESREYHRVEEYACECLRHYPLERDVSKRARTVEATYSVDSEYMLTVGEFESLSPNQIYNLGMKRGLKSKFEFSYK